MKYGMLNLCYKNDAEYDDGSKYNGGHPGGLVSDADRLIDSWLDFDIYRHKQNHPATIGKKWIDCGTPPKKMIDDMKKRLSSIIKDPMGFMRKYPLTKKEEKKYRKQFEEIEQKYNYLNADGFMTNLYNTFYFKPKLREYFNGGGVGTAKIGMYVFKNFYKWLKSKPQEERE